MKGYCHYFVEGADEKRLLDTLKTDMRLILPGKVEKFNVVQDKLKFLKRQKSQIKDNLYYAGYES